MCSNSLTQVKMIWADGRLDTFRILEVIETVATTDCVEPPPSDLPQPDNHGGGIDLLDMMMRKYGDCKRTDDQYHH